ncbi:MAG TPA: 50S ribosomal protein L16 [bacterium]|jgi:large subunit ribosomal protein L16|nr:50S ribosomal protein L16 [bacterium]HPO11136.1 50S ribosomal protein L16 [bacterium]HPV55129.1 50S ribosomal protein L16 [Bacilli bacterium]
MSLLSPRKIKHRKQQKGRRRGLGVATSKINVSYGTYGLRALESKWITARQIEAARVAISKVIAKNKGARMFIRVFPDKPITNHGNESVMGSGKGSLDHYVVPVKPGMILFEIDGVDEDMAKLAFLRASHKLPVKTKFAKREII